jgi:hypothetical protein
MSNYQIIIILLNKILNFYHSKNKIMENKEKQKENVNTNDKPIANIFFFIKFFLRLVFPKNGNCWLLIVQILIYFGSVCFFIFLFDD